MTDPSKRASGAGPDLTPQPPLPRGEGESERAPHVAPLAEQFAGDPQSPAARAGSPTGGEEPGEGAVLLLDNDLFFAVKIRDTLAHAGYNTHQSRNLADFTGWLAEHRPALAIVNTAARGLDWRAAIAAARAGNVPVLALGAHVDVETQAAARAAGATRVVANSRLAGDLVGTVARTIQLGAGSAAAVEGTPPDDDG